VDTYSGAGPFKQGTFHLRIFTIESRETLIRIYRADSQQEEVRAHPQNLSERPAIHRSASEGIDLPPIVMRVRSFRSARTAAIVGSWVPREANMETQPNAIEALIFDIRMDGVLIVNCEPLHSGAERQAFEEAGSESQNHFLQSGAAFAATRTSAFILICDPPSRFSKSTACLPTRTSRESTGFPVFPFFKKLCSVLSTLYSRVFRHFTIGFSHALAWNCNCIASRNSIACRTGDGGDTRF
jgi:hypothetical protein